MFRCVFLSTLIVAISLIDVSGTRAQAQPPPGNLPGPVQQSPAAPQSPPAPSQVQIAPAANTPSDTPPMPSAQQLVSLVRNVLLAVNDANLTGNYTVLRDLSAPDSQALNTPERLEESFRPIRQQGTDFAIVAAATPRFTQLPAFTPQGYLRVNGEFDSSPRITFDIFLERVAGRWRPYAIGVGVVPIAVTSPPAAEAKAAPKMKAVAPRKPQPAKP